MGIEPPDFEAELNERIRLAAQAEEERLCQQQEITIVYDYLPKQTETKPDDTRPQ